MSYWFSITMPSGRDVEPNFSDALPAFVHDETGDGMAGTVMLTETGDIRCGNYTSNVSPMWRKCLTAVQATGENIGLRDLHGKKCGDILMHLVAAVDWGVEHIAELREMNPDNGWGNAEGAITYLWDIQRMCEDHPNGTLRISS